MKINELLEKVERGKPSLYAKVIYIIDVKRPNKNPRSAEEQEKNLKRSLRSYNGKIVKEQGGSKYGKRDTKFEFAWLVAFEKYKDYYNFKHENDDATHTFIDSVDERLIDKDWYSFQPKGIIYK